MSARLLFDQNLAPRLARDLADLFPHSAHVRDLNLQTASDEEIWAQAADGCAFIDDPQLALLALGRRRP